MINKSEEASRFGVDERLIQRGIDDIRAFLDVQNINASNGGISIIFDRTLKGFRMAGIEESYMSNSEIL